MVKTVIKEIVKIDGSRKLQIVMNTISRAPKSKMGKPKLVHRYDVILTDSTLLEDKSVSDLWTKQEAMGHFNYLKGKFFQPEKI